MQPLFFLLLFVGAYSQVMIYNCSQLQSLTPNDTSLVYLLANDVDCSTVPNFSPVGNCSQNTSFQGLLDGQNYTVSNLFINVSQNGVGIIGNAFNATIKNIRVQNGSVYAYGPANAQISGIGILLGNGASTIVTNCHLEANGSSANYVGTNGKIVGGLIGALSGTGSLISNCTAASTLLDGDPLYSNSVGGLIGSVQGGALMTDCHNFGFHGNSSSVVARGSNAVGGVVGFIWSASVSKSGITLGT